MPRMTATKLCVMTPFVFCGLAHGQQTTLTADQAQSSVDVEACVDAGSGPVCETGNSALEGDITITVDDAAAPTTIAIDDFLFSNVSSIQLVYSFGFLGSATVNASSFSIEYDGVGPTTAAAIGGDGAFAVVDVPVLALISGDFTSSGLVAAVVGSGVIDEVAMIPGTIDGVLTIDPMTGDYIATFTFATQQMGDLDGTAVDIGTNGMLVASGPAPVADVCIGDVNGDGSLNGLDFGAWLSAFNAGLPAADQNLDGMVNGIDFGAWLANFNAGCD